MAAGFFSLFSTLMISFTKTLEVSLANIDRAIQKCIENPVEHLYGAFLRNYFRKKVSF